MKRVFALTALAAILLLGACKKEKQNVESYHFSPNRVVTVSSDSKTSSNTFFVMSIGHDAKDCNGCIMSGGQFYHINCMGFGNVCNRTVSVALNQVGSTITATTTDTFDLTSEDYFLMPARSLYYYTEDNNNHVYLNIPEQMVYRDTATLQFTFTGLFLTNVPEYNND